MQSVVLCLFVSTLVVGRANTATSGTGDVVSTNPSTNTFVADVAECRRLSPSRPMNICSIDYEVPAGIAALAEVIEYEISGKVLEVAPRERCSRRDVLEALCAFRFPRCNGTNVIMKSIPDCSPKTSRCRGSRLVEAEGICSLDAVVPLDSCVKVSSIPAWNQFQRCSAVDGNTRITAWMAEYMRLTDLELQRKLNDSSISSLGGAPNCARGANLYFCQFYGQCTPDGGAIEVINSERSCNDVLNCYPDMSAEVLRETINCASWPVGRPRPTNNNISITTKAVPPTSNSGAQSPALSAINSWPSPPIGKGSSIQYVTVTGTASLIFAVFISILL